MTSKIEIKRMPLLLWTLSDKFCCEWNWIGLLIFDDGNDLVGDVMSYRNWCMEREGKIYTLLFSIPQFNGNGVDKQGKIFTNLMGISENRLPFSVWSDCLDMYWHYKLGQKLFWSDIDKETHQYYLLSKALC